MKKYNVSIEVNGQSFRAEAQINQSELGEEVDGVFTFPALSEEAQLLAELAIHSTNSPKTGTSHVVRFLNGQESYRFTMKSKGSLEFNAVRADINPATGRPAFAR